MSHITPKQVSQQRLKHVAYMLLTGDYEIVDIDIEEISKGHLDGFAIYEQGDIIVRIRKKDARKETNKS